MKIAKLQDVHVNPRWIDESKDSISRACKVAKSENVDAITVAGDFFDRLVLASDKGSWGEILQLARSLQAVAQVYYISGTPGHDSPGCYESFKDIGWKEISIGKSEIIGNTLIMGIPEITQEVLIANFPELSKTEVIAKQYDLVNQIIDSYYAPLAKNHKGHVHFMSHGHVAGAKFRDDQKPRTSDFMYSDEMLNRIGADSIQFGHIHLPQKYYGGSAHIGWGDLGFVPGFDILDTETNEDTRFHFNQLARYKIVIKDVNNIAAAYNVISSGKYRDTNLWVDIKCDKEFNDQFDKNKELENLILSGNLGPLSKITTDVQHIEHSRVDTEEYEKCHTTEDIYKIYDPEATESILLKVKEAEQETLSEVGSIEKHAFEFLELYLRGSKAGLENGVEEIKMSWADFQTGANLLIGENGTGKTFSLGFCTPISEHMPTGISFKDLFELKDSQIVRRWKDVVSDKIITQKILIDPTLAKPTAKFYMDIDGVPCPGVTGNKASFDSAVLDLFGSAKMFMACAFRGQKPNKDYPFLENATENDLRQIFTELSGLDRTPLKEYAKDKGKSLKRDIDMDSRDKINLEESLENPKELKSQIKNNTTSISENKKTIELDNKNLFNAQTTIDSIKTLKTENEGNNKEIDRLKNSNVILNNEVLTLTNSLTDLNSTLENSDKYKSELKQLEGLDKQHGLASKKYFDAQGIFNKSVTDWDIIKTDINTELQGIADKANSIKEQIATLESSICNSNSIIRENEKTIKLLDKPCEHCNKNSSYNQAEIKKLQNAIRQREKIVSENRGEISALDLKLEKYRTDDDTLKKSIPQKPQETFELSQLKKTADDLGSRCDDAKLLKLQTLVEGMEESTSKRLDVQNQIISKENIIKENIARIEQVTAQLNIIDEEVFKTASYDVFTLQSKINKLSTENGRLEAENSALKARLLKHDERVLKIEEINSRVAEKQKNITEWEIIESAFDKKGIPAMELSLQAPIIDREANRLLSIYGTRYKVETITQDFDSTGKNLVEKFKILVHDEKSSEIKNLPVISGGQGVWVTKALQEAISKVASERSGRTWLYSIMDEADGALDSEIIPVFYDMLDKALDGKRKLVSVTHSTEAKNCITSVKNITEFFVGYKE